MVFAIGTTLALGVCSVAEAETVVVDQGQAVARMVVDHDAYCILTQKQHVLIPGKWEAGKRQ